MLFKVKNQEAPSGGWWGDSKSYVVGIVDSDGVLVPKSDSNTVRIPFDSDYGILLKNTTGAPCAITIEVDGTSIIGEDRIELDANSKVIVDRFCVDGELTKGKKLKFVTKDSEEVQDPTSKSNGNVIVTFIPAKRPVPVVRPRGVVHYAANDIPVVKGLSSRFDGQGIQGSRGVSSDPIIGSSAAQSFSACLGDFAMSNDVMDCSASYNDDVDVFQDSEWVKTAGGIKIPKSDIGATVEGKESDQVFEQGKKLDLEEDNKFVVSFNLRGEVEVEDKSVDGEYRCKAGFSLDRSSSMSSKRRAAIEGFNDQLAKLKESPENVETTVTFGTFATEVDEFHFEDKPVDLVPEINEGNYVPSGSTAMLDGVGEMIEALYTSPNAHDENTSFLVVIVTDGEENSSSVYDWEDISHLITRLQNTGRWTFVYLGTNQNLAEVQKNMGLSAGNVKLFNDNSEGYFDASQITSASTGQYLKGLAKGVKAADNFYGQ